MADQTNPENVPEQAPEAQDAPSTDAGQFEYPSLEEGAVGQAPDGLSLLSDVNLNVTIELGRTEMLVSDVLELGEGSVVELDKLAGDPVDIYVNERPVARGEVLVLNENFCVRVSEILAPMIVEEGTPAQASGRPTAGEASTVTEQEAA